MNVCFASSEKPVHLLDFIQLIVASLAQMPSETNSSQKQS